MIFSYFKNLKNRFFYKLLLLYAAIMIATISLLIFIIAYNITSILKEQAVNYNKQILQTVDTYFYNQNKYFKKIMSNLYAEEPGQDAQVIQHIQQFIKGGTTSFDSENFRNRIESTRILNDYLSKIVASNDSGIKDIVVINPTFDFYIGVSKLAFRPYLTDYYANLCKYISDNKQANINIQKTYIIPPLKATQNANSVNIYGIYDYLRVNNDSSNFIGYLVFTYSTDSIKNAYSQFSKYMIGDVLVVSYDGNVIFDSSEKYYNKPFTYLEQLRTSAGNTIRDKDYIINVIKNNEFGFMVVGMISKSELYKNVNSLNRFIIVTSFLSIILILGLTFLSTGKFSKRVKNIIETIMEIQKGNLSARATVKENNDEIEQIANNLNIMTEKLDEYIKREYISELRRTNAELKQKTAELYALQSQINPHFLYNTLEAIRMRALSGGDRTTGDMLKILAKLFRSNIKDEMVVSIEEEINYSKSYLELYSIRFGDRLDVVYDIDPDIMGYAIIKHLLQPIIENSIVHGINLNKVNNVIKVKGRKVNDLIEISVSDNGNGIDEKKLETIIATLKTPRLHYKDNIGLFNVNSRIKLIYGNDYGLRISSSPGMGTEVVLRIIAFTREELLKNVQSNDY